MADRLLLLLLLSGLPSVICESLESIPSSPVVQEAGTTLDLSCKGSGYNFGSYYTHWIRQPAGKPLEWIGYSEDSAESVKGRIEITDDDPNSVVYLKLSALKAEDTAVYYCARDTASHMCG
uniref:Immunoglobulin heavy variable 4-5 n=1 Tax=Paramormyrops kingsleyae TaxID=1676925 RepID=A0A3B3RQY0_9TELE